MLTFAGDAGAGGYQPSAAPGRSSTPVACSRVDYGGPELVSRRVSQPISPRRVALPVETAETLFKSIGKPAERFRPGIVVPGGREVFHRPGQAVSPTEGGVEGVQVEGDHVPGAALDGHARDFPVAGELVGAQAGAGVVVVRAGHEAKGPLPAPSWSK